MGGGEPLVRLLGSVALGSGPSRLTGTKQQLLLSLLAIDPGGPVSVDRLSDAIWPDAGPDRPTRALQVHVSKLRPPLSEVADATIEHEAGGYALHIDPDRIDAVRFERLIRSAEAAGGPEETSVQLADALQLFRGDPFGPLGDVPALVPEARRLQELRLHAVEARAAADLELGRHHTVAADLSSLVAVHPLREGLWEHLVVALYRSGRQGAALDAYERARCALRDQLGVDPSPALRDLHRRVLDHDPSLDQPPATSATTAPRRPHVAAPALAILPFDTIGAAGDHLVTLASGLHNDLITALSRARGLRVVGRRSVLGYADSDEPLHRIAAELEVTDVLEGTIQTVGDRMRLSVRLVSPTGDVARWVGSYDDDVTLDNLLAIQSDLAREIASSLSAELLATHTVDAGTADLDAYRLVALARSQFDLKTEEGFQNAAASYSEAIRLDPGYVDAFTGLAISLASADAYGHGDRHDLLPRAEQAVHRALALAPNDGSVRTALGVLHVGHQNGPAAIAELERATAIDAGHADAWSWLCWVRLLTGDATGGHHAARRAAQLDPRAAEARAHLALAHAAVGDPATGLTEARLAGQLSPYDTAPLYEALCLSELGRHAEVVDLLTPRAQDRSTSIPWTGAGPEALLGVALARSGRDDQARAALDAIDATAFPFAAGLVHLALDDVPAAVAAFGRVRRLTAWPCLVLHHFHHELWTLLEGTGCQSALVRLARRSWSMPVEGGERGESGT